ncbi:MAG: phage/plasmid primase, P4 family [Nanoarchaeota archaeon]
MSDKKPTQVKKIDNPPDIKKATKELLAMIKKELGREFDFSNFILNSPVFFDENSLWWAWNKNLFSWKIVDEIFILNSFQDFFNLEAGQIYKFKNFIITILRLNSRRNKPEELTPYCIQFKNKIFNLKTEQEFIATSKYFLTSPIPYELSKDSETPIIDKLFTDWVGETWKPTLYEVLAYSCLREQFLQSIIALTGAGSNGKGTFQNLLIKFLGRENCVSSNIKSLINRSFETSALYKKLLCVVGEVDSHDLTNTNLIKQFTGEDLIRYEFKGKTPFSEFSPTTFIIATNSLPLTPDKSDGFYRRFLIIDFPNQFIINRELLNQIPELEFNNLTRKIINILLSLIKKQEFTNSGTIEERRSRYEERSNPLMMFVSESYDETGTGCVKLREFSKKYNLFLKSKKLRQKTVNEVGKDLRIEGFEVSPRKYRDEQGEIVDSAKSIIGISVKRSELHGENTGSLGSQENVGTTQTTGINGGSIIKVGFKK